MASSSEAGGVQDAALNDPYVLDPAKIRTPPRGWVPSLRFLGPGMITSAAVVGSGELITATTLGAEVGFVLLWLVFVSTFVKVAVQIEVARWSISTGRPAIDGYDQVPPRVRGRGWVTYLAILMFLQFLTSQAGVLGAAGLALSILMPIDGDPASTVSIGFWGLVMVLVAIMVHFTNRYAIVERFSTGLVLLVTVAVGVLVLGLQATPFAWSAADLASGMQFQLSAGAMGVALAMFGLTGVGAGEITSYSYWCVEKGYAAWTGPNDGSDGWAERARGWIAVMKKDAWLSWIIYTLSTAAFYILGAAVLNPQGLVPEGTGVLTTISRIFSDTLGSWAGTIFLIFAAITLFKTILANVPSLCRQIANSVALFGFFDWSDPVARGRWMRGLMIVMPVCWGFLGVLVNSPLALVVLGGILNALYLLAVAVAAVYLSFRRTDRRITDGRLFTAYLLFSAVAIFAVGLIALTT
ncbi:Nramp family divalent metal transporter [Amycolatopsis lurida]